MKTAIAISSNLPKSVSYDTKQSISLAFDHPLLPAHGDIHLCESETSYRDGNGHFSMSNIISQVTVICYE